MNLNLNLTPPGRDISKGYKYRFLFFLFPTTIVSLLFGLVLC